MEAKVFSAYSNYYDLLYLDKDYIAETEHVNSLINSYSKNAKSILELGSGTGIHASFLANLGYEVTGIDQSKPMLNKAEERKKRLHKSIANRLSFYEGDIRSYQSKDKFDVVISLFHVMSYMETDTDLIKAIQTAANNLKRDGLFIFDCWHGPGVLNDKPVSRSKFIVNKAILVKRKSTPEIFLKKNVVEVNFDIVIQNKKTKEETTLYEKHKMRYLFTDELKNLLETNNLNIIHTEEWLTKKPLSETSWNACYVCRVGS
jgi:SAM-dependent methyltransferase